MARSVEGDKVLGRISRVSRKSRGTLVQPLQGSTGVPKAPGVSKYDFLDLKHPIYSAWIERWIANEARLAGGDDVADELRPFEWETDVSDSGFYAKRKREAVYTNFPDIFMTAITGHLMRFAPKPDQGWAVPNLGKVGTQSQDPSRAEQIWYSVDNPSGAGAEWNQFWMDAVKRSAATGHRWMYVEAPTEPAKNRAREKQGYRPYLVEYSPVDTYNWFINERDVLEFVVFRTPNPGPQLIDGQMQATPDTMRGYLLLVRQGCTRLGEEFKGGGWWKFDGNKSIIDTDTWAATGGEIPVSVLYYQRSKGTAMTPAISRPGTTELGQAAVALMNMTSSANYNAWEAGGGVDYLEGIDEDAFGEVERLSRLGSRRIPLPPNSETDAIPSVAPSSLGAVQSDIFTKREDAIWAAAVRLGIIEAAGQVGGSGNGSSGATAEATFSAVLGPRIVWLAQNLGVCQNNIIRYFELRYGFTKPTGLTNWPNKFDLVPVIDRIRSFFETERLSGVRSTTVGATAMVMAAEDKGLVASPEDKAKIMQEYVKAGELVQSQAQANLDSTKQKNQNPAGVLTPPQNDTTRKSQADRLALQKAGRTRGKAGRRGPKQAPVQPPAPGVKR